MSRILVLALALCVAPLAAQLNTIQTVYLFPMGSGLDQYLANRLTSQGVLQVVTDPLKADAVFTDRLGEGFEARFTELYITPGEEKKQAEERKAKAEAKKAKAKEKGGKDEDEEATTPEAGKFVDKSPARTTSFGRGRGTLFLVERKSQSVVWSVYEPPKSSNPHEMDRAASRITDKLKKARGK